MRSALIAISAFTCRHPRRATVGFLLAALLGGGCEERTGPDPQPDRSSVTLTPTQTTVAVFDTILLAATVRDAEGTAINSPSVTWTSSDPAVATAQPSPTGSVPWVAFATVVGVSPGSATITATSGTASARATVTVSLSSLSPPGLAFVSQRDGNEEIYRMNADGSGQVRLTTNARADRDPVWSPQGTMIAFESARTFTNIWIMSADGSAQRRLSQGNIACGLDPAWSPSVQRIAFNLITDCYLGFLTAHVAVINVDGSAQRSLAMGPVLNERLAWSPDGQKIAFVSGRDGNKGVYVMNADGSAPTNLTSTAANDDDPQWSPDGQKIAFVSERDGNGEIYVMNADGSAQTNLTNNAALDRNPQWSPDGQKIAFVSDRDGSKGIYVMNADGSAQTYLTSAAGNDDDAQWSPDGQKIAFVSSRDGNAEIYVMNADGSAQTNLTNNRAPDVYPRWRP